MATTKLTTAQERELRCIARSGEVGDLYDYGSNSLAFYAREKTLTALLRRELIEADDAGGYSLTEAGRAALAERCPDARR